MTAVFMVKVTLGLACAWFLSNTLLGIWANSLDFGMQAKVMLREVDWKEHKTVFILGAIYLLMKVLTPLSALITAIMLIAGV